MDSFFCLFHWDKIYETAVFHIMCLLTVVFILFITELCVNFTTTGKTNTRVNQHMHPYKHARARAHTHNTDDLHRQSWKNLYVLNRTHVHRIMVTCSSIAVVAVAGFRVLVDICSIILYNNGVCYYSSVKPRPLCCVLQCGQVRGCRGCREGGGWRSRTGYTGISQLVLDLPDSTCRERCVSVSVS